MAYIATTVDPAEKYRVGKVVALRGKTVLLEETALMTAGDYELHRMRDSVFTILVDMKNQLINVRQTQNLNKFGKDAEDDDTYLVKVELKTVIDACTACIDWIADPVNNSEVVRSVMKANGNITFNSVTSAETAPLVVLITALTDLIV